MRRTDIYFKSREEKMEVLNKEKTITMKEIMLGLGIDFGDIVKVKSKVLACAGNYDLIDLNDSRYSSEIPNLILGMVSGKHDYIVYKIKEAVEHKKES